MVLVPQGCEQRLHAWWEALPLVVVKVRQTNFFGVLWGSNLGQIEVDCIMVRQIDEQLAQPSILQDRW
jgi:hypothetical protein